LNSVEAWSDSVLLSRKGREVSLTVMIVLTRLSIEYKYGDQAGMNMLNVMIHQPEDGSTVTGLLPSLPAGILRVWVIGSFELAFLLPLHLEDDRTSWFMTKPGRSAGIVDPKCGSSSSKRRRAVNDSGRSSGGLRSTMDTRDSTSDVVRSFESSACLFKAS
jgi:hypothetical protein